VNCQKYLTLKMMLSEVKVRNSGLQIILETLMSFIWVTIGNPELIIQGESMFE
jgi:hypothetical protein